MECDIDPLDKNNAEYSCTGMPARSCDWRVCGATSGFTCIRRLVLAIRALPCTLMSRHCGVNPVNEGGYFSVYRWSSSTAREGTPRDHPYQFLLVFFVVGYQWTTRVTLNGEKNIYIILLLVVLHEHSYKDTITNCPLKINQTLENRKIILTP